MKNKDASMEESRQPHELRAIMESIQELVYTVISLQLASGRQHMGGQNQRGESKEFRYKSPGRQGSQNPAQDRHLMDKLSARANKKCPLIP